jgi:hypothetical protein
VVAISVFGQSGPSMHFTVTDEIGLTQLGRPSEAISLSPNGGYIVVKSERGLLKQNCPEDELHVYRTSRLLDFVNGAGAAPTPVWSFGKRLPRKVP